MANRAMMLWRALPLAFAVTAIPVAFSPSHGLRPNDGWCDGTCCPEPRSWCNIGGGVDHENYYRKQFGGSCNENES